MTAQQSWNVMVVMDIVLGLTETVCDCSTELDSEGRVLDTVQGLTEAVCDCSKELGCDCRVMKTVQGLTQTL